MHVPDGFLDLTTSIATGIIAVGGVALALRGARKELDERTAPLAGLVAAFVFATQMINFPVGAGTSGHLLGGALAAALVGPWTGVLVITVVLFVQALLFADGGLTALGTNITLMGLVGVGIGWLVLVAVRKLLPKRLASVPIAAAIGALVSVPVAALVFTVRSPSVAWPTIPVGTVATAMVGWHTLIGIGEAVITGLVVSSVVATRPDLVYAARPVLTADPWSCGRKRCRHESTTRPDASNRRFFAILSSALVALVIARRGSASTPPAIRTAWSTSPSSPDSWTPPQDSADCGQPAGRLRRHGRRECAPLRRPGRHHRRAGDAAAGRRPGLACSARGDTTSAREA